jgi:hypothetical protein
MTLVTVFAALTGNSVLVIVPKRMYIFFTGDLRTVLLFGAALSRSWKEAAGLSETLEPVSRTTRRHITEDSVLYSYHRENI